MENVKYELLQEIEGVLKIKCAEIRINQDSKMSRFILKVGYSNDEYNEFLSKLNIDYDNGFGEQNVFGIIWMIDKTWIEREERDGKEWWTRRINPEIPNFLK